MHYPTGFTRVVDLKGDHIGRSALLRPVCELDIPMIRDYLLAMPAEERYLRYMNSNSPFALVDTKRLDRRYHLDYETHMAFVVVAGEAILGVAHAHGPSPSEGGCYEVTYSRHTDYKGAGVGTALMEGLIEWGTTTYLPGLFADTLFENTRMRALFEKFGFARTPHPDGGFSVVRYRLPLHSA
jgi:RimJ/RimL family protein N-acetyltransferase